MFSEGWHEHPAAAQTRTHGRHAADSLAAITQFTSTPLRNIQCKLIPVLPLTIHCSLFVQFLVVWLGASKVLNFGDAGMTFFTGQIHASI